MQGPFSDFPSWAPALGHFFLGHVNICLLTPDKTSMRHQRNVSPKDYFSESMTTSKVTAPKLTNAGSQEIPPYLPGNLASHLLLRNLLLYGFEGSLYEYCKFKDLPVPCTLFISCVLRPSGGNIPMLSHPFLWPDSYILPAYSTVPLSLRGNHRDVWWSSVTYSRALGYYTTRSHSFPGVWPVINLYSILASYK